jgi:ketosteroid isomerase-like protein
MLLAVAACQPAAETPEQAQARIDSESTAAKTTIDSLATEFATHLNAGHADIVAGFYTENATAMPPNAPVANGRAAIQAVIQGFVDMKAQLTLTPVSVVANGPVAVERGTYSVTLTPPGATAPMTDTGKYLVHWHRVDGKWMLAEDIWNSDLPPPAPPPTSARRR